MATDVKFADAPFIHPNNAPRYHASQIRARNYAQRTRKMLLWVIAEDKPLHRDLTSLAPADLHRRKQQWMTLHDQQTSGVMGLQPLAEGMPLRITSTIHDQRDKNLFKNTRVRLVACKLHPADELRLQACHESELILQHMPEKVFVRVPGAKWIKYPKLGAGVVDLKPKLVTWALDKDFSVCVKRRGFPIASDFGGTVHSFVGSTLPAGLVDCLPWDHEPTRENQLSGYMSISRLERMEDVCIIQPFAPNLFSQGDLPGPDIVLEVLA
jgi:hypothetical protein